MAIIASPLQVNKFSTLESDFGTTICPALWIKTAQLAKYIQASFPIGMIMFFEGDQANLPAQPDSRFWQLLDGSTVSNTNSPLHGVTLPDFRNRFFRHANTGEVVHIPAGSDSVSLSHNHTGNTGFASEWDSLNLDNGDARRQAIGTHRHTIPSDLGSVTTIPAYHSVQCYLRIA